MRSNKIGLSTIRVLLLIGTISIVLSACKKKSDDETPPSSASDKGTMLLHLHTYLENEEVQFYNIAYTMSDGRDISVSLAQLYISDIELIKLDGSTVSLPGKKILQVRETDLYAVGEIPVGNYNTIRFKVGLNAATNALNPSSSPDSALLNKPEMWINSTAQPDGYAFLHLKGQIDTSSSLSGLFAPFEYKIGTNAHFKQVVVTGINLTIVKGQAEITHLITDYYKLFNGVQINQPGNLSITTTAENGSPLATIIANNIQQMFRTE